MSIMRAQRQALNLLVFIVAMVLLGWLIAGSSPWWVFLPLAAVSLEALWHFGRRVYEFLPQDEKFWIVIFAVSSFVIGSVLSGEPK
jgi:hypothetical protein